jgi:hypothetical protein
MVVVFTVPPDGTNGVMLVPNPVPVVVDTSKPVGAVTVKLPVKFEPATVNVCSPDTVPAQAVKGVNVPVLVIVVGCTTLHTGVNVVRAISHPPLKFPISPDTSSTTYKLQVPLGFCPLNADANVAVPAVAGFR